MQEVLDFFISNNGAAFAVALIIFIITLWLVVKRFIGFVFTIILLAFALVSGLFVANADLFREILKGFTPNSTPEEKDTLTQLKNQFFKATDELKKDYQEQRAEFQKIIDRAKTRDEAKPLETPKAPEIQRSLDIPEKDKPVTK